MCHKILTQLFDSDQIMANAYRIALIVSLEDLLGRVQVFGDTLTLAKYCQREWPSPVWPDNHTKVAATLRK